MWSIREIRSDRSVVALVIFALIAAVASGCESAENEIPTAATTGSVSVLAGFPATLDGSRSSDPDGDDLKYRWDLIGRPAGSEARIISPGTPKPVFTPDMPGDYALTLAVNDVQSWGPPAGITVQAMPWFTEVAAEAKVQGSGPQMEQWFMGEAPGGAFGDYDDDGDLDLFITGDGLKKLYRNDGNGRFTDVAERAGVAGRRGMCNGFGASWGDYDNDDDLDLYVTCHSEDTRFLDVPASEPNILYRNNGDGTFTDVAAEAGVDHVAKGTRANWVDYDRDGNLDLFVGNFGIFGMMGEEHRGESNALYRNNGDGTFTNVTDIAGIAGVTEGDEIFTMFRYGGDLRKSGMTFGGLWFDYNNDGDPDLLECNDEGASPLYENNGDGTFTDVTEAAGLFTFGSCMGVDAGDYDRDGDLDIYWTNFGENYLWRNNSDGTFTEVAQAAGVDDVFVGWATRFTDVDNDGLLDLYVVNGLVGPVIPEIGRVWRQPNILYRNNGDGTFSDITLLAGFGSEAIGRGAATGDYNNDGAIDIYVLNADDHNLLYRNEVGARNNWLKVNFEGSRSNRDGFGARVTVDTGEWSQIAEVISGTGYLAGNGPQLHFGLGQHEIIKEITVQWPSGARQVLGNVPANQTLLVLEAEAGS